MDGTSRTPGHLSTPPGLQGEEQREGGGEERKEGGKEGEREGKRMERLMKGLWEWRREGKKYGLGIGT